MRDIEKEIEERWFSNHKATYVEHGDLKVLTWKEEGTICYHVRYVFDGGKMYVSGDLGEAVFCFTEKADVHIQSQYSLDYFESKLQAYHGDKKEFNSVIAVKELREWVNTLKENGTEYDHDEMRELFESARSCSRLSEWAGIINESHHDFISNLDCDYWEWMYNLGSETPIRLRSYLIGLKMASKQLKSKVDVA